MKKPHILLIILVAIVMIIYGNITIKTNPSEVEELNIFLEITDNNSLEIQGKNIYFASPPGGTLGGTTLMKNKKDIEKTVEIFSKGELAELGWLEIKEKKFTINPGETKAIEIKINIPIYANGKYTGKLEIKGK